MRPNSVLNGRTARTFCTRIEAGLVESKRGAVRVGNEDVALPRTVCTWRGLRRIVLDDAAQAPDRHVEAAIAEREIVAMHEIVNQHARQHLVRMLDEDLEQRELAVAQRRCARRRATASA